MASATQLAALSVTHQHFEDSQTALLKQKLNDVMLEMERKSMAAEDARAHLLSPYDNVHTTDPRHRPLTWKEHALYSDAMVHNLTDNVITPARFFVQLARQKAMQVGTRPDAPTQQDVIKCLVDAGNCFSESESDESDPSDEY